MPKDLIDFICILERDEKCHSYKIIRKRKYFTLVTKFPAKNGESTPLKKQLNRKRKSRKNKSSTLPSGSKSAKQHSDKKI